MAQLPDTLGKHPAELFARFLLVLTFGYVGIRKRLAKGDSDEVPLPLLLASASFRRGPWRVSGLAGRRASGLPPGRGGQLDRDVHEPERNGAFPHGARHSRLTEAGTAPAGVLLLRGDT